MTPGFDCAFATTAPHKATAIHRIFPIFIIFSFKSSFFNPFPRRSSEPPLPYRSFRTCPLRVIIPAQNNGGVTARPFRPNRARFTVFSTCGQRNVRPLATFPAGQTLGIPSLPVRDDHPSATHPRTADRAPSAACSGSLSQLTRRLIPSPRFYNVGHRHRVSVPPTIRPASIFKTTFRPDRARPVGPSHLRISTRFTIARTFHLIKAFRTSNSGAHPVYDVLHPLKAVFYPDRTRPESPIYGGPPAPDRPYLPLTRMRPNTEYTNLTPEPIIRAASIQGQRLGRIGSAAHCLYFPRCRPPRQAHGCIIRFRRSKDSEAENLRSDFTIRTIARIRPTMLQSEHRTEAGTGFAERPTRTVVGQQPARSSTS